MKKKLLVVSAICAISLSFALPPDTDPSLIIWHKDGSKVILNLEEKPKISYVGENVVIESSETIECKFKAIRKMTYGSDFVTDMESPISPKEKPFINEGKTITFLPADRDLRVKVVLVNGIVFKDFVVKKGESFSLHLDSFPTNIYMINVNGVTYKIKLR